MSTISNDIASATPPLTAMRAAAGWARSSGKSPVIIYLSNGRDIGSDDTFSATLLALNFVRGEGVYL